MSLREDMQKYEQITGESAEHVPIIRIGSVIDGYEIAMKENVRIAIDSIKATAIESEIRRDDISKEKVEEIRRYLIENIFRNPNVMFDDNIRGYDDNDIDLISIICDLYEYIHVLVYGEKYDYMFHWANKCGSWVETGDFDKIIEEIMKEKRRLKKNE